MDSAEKRREYNAKYWRTHKKEIQSRRREFYKENRERILARNKQYFIENREAWNAYMRNYRKRKKEESKTND